MKNLLSLFLALLLLTPTADAQRRKKTAKRKAATSRSYANYDQNFYNFVGENDGGPDMSVQMAKMRRYDSTYTFVSRTRYGGWSRTMNDETEGVMGRDEIRLNEKGEYRNLNSNTGVPLPPTTGR